MQTINELTVELNRLKIKKTAVMYTLSSSSQNFKTFGHILEKIDSQITFTSQSLAIAFIDCISYLQVLQLRRDITEVEKVAFRLCIDTKYVKAALDSEYNYHTEEYNS